MPLADISPSWLKLLPFLDEAQLRVCAAEKALSLGYGGIKRVHAATGLSLPTIRRGIKELRDPASLPPADRVRRRGGGRRALEATHPTLRRDLERILDETTAGDPMSPLKWTLKSTRRIAQELARRGHRVSAMSVWSLVDSLGYSLQANQRTKEGGDHPDRDSQFRYIAFQVKAFEKTGDPVVSVDTKKRELVGDFKNAGRRYQRKGQPRQVGAYDFRSLALGVAIPYGLYDLRRNEGMVSVGVSRDTAEFAVESIGHWWRRLGHRHYPQARRLLICADGGGSNGSRNRLWRRSLQSLSDRTGIAVTVCHYPPGTSKWNKIEHRMFSFISTNWQGKPLETYETVINLIGGTTTKTGLKVTARLDTKDYEKGIEVSDEEIGQLRLRPHSRNPQWNYTIEPRGPDVMASQMQRDIQKE